MKTIKNRVLVISVDDWEAIYVDGKCVAQGHYIDVRTALKLAKFKYSEIVFAWADPKDDDLVSTLGCFPSEQSKLKGTYESKD
jgi:hypothetical protein